MAGPGSLDPVLRRSWHVNSPRTWPSWKGIEAAAHAGASYRTWKRMDRAGEASSAPWSATLEEAYTRALIELSRRAEARAVQPASRLPNHEDAISFYRAMLERLHFPSGEAAPMAAGARADINLWLGHALRIIGRSEDAIEAYRAAAHACPGFGDAYWSLANLKTYCFTDGEVAGMQDALSANEIEETDRIHLAFALGKALEDRADYAGAWDCYVEGNALRHRTNGYRPEQFDAHVAAQIKTCDARFFEARQGWGDARPDPIFILGLPRSGSTLVEQILASHSAVDGTRELLAIERIAHDLDRRHPGYQAMLERLTAEDCRQLGERYLTMTRAHRRARPFFIDKMPNNFAHIGLISLILPNARIIDVRRHPMACCFSNFKQLFAGSQPFSYSIDGIARYYRAYLALMRHWDAVLPGRALRVIHEDLVANLDGEVRRILGYCGLPFEAACLGFHETQRSVHTPSSEQVRRPINRDGLDQWRHFAFALDPLKAALGDALTDWR